MPYNRSKPKSYSPLLNLRDCRHGHMLYFPHDVYIGGSLERYGEYCEVECAFLCRMLFENDTAIDVGANIGGLTLGMAKRVGMGGRVYAFEPQRIVFNMLCANIALNAAWNIFAKHEALASTQTMLGVPPIDYTMPNNFGDVRLSRTDTPEMVRASTIDSMELPACRLIKIDVQGMEAEVIAGAADTITRCKPFLYVENDENTSALPELIREFGYDVYEHKTPLFNPENYRGDRLNVFQNIASYNILGVAHEYRPTVKVELKLWQFEASETR